MADEQLRCDYKGEPIPEGEEVVFILSNAGPTPDTIEEMIDEAASKIVYKIPDEFQYLMCKDCAKAVLNNPDTFENSNASYVILKGSIE